MLIRKEDFQYLKKMHEDPGYKKFLIAYHEAGHVVACILLKRWFSYVTIKPKDSRSCQGKVMHKDNQTERNIGQRDIIIKYAGDIAESFFFNIFLHEDGMLPDDAEILDIPINDEDFGMADCFEGVIEDLKGSDALKVESYSDLYEKTMGLLSDYWHAVELVAAHLLKHNKLKYYEVRNLMKECGAINCT